MRYRFQSFEKVYEVDLSRQEDLLRAVVDGCEHELEMVDRQPGQLSLRFDGLPMTFYWAVKSGTIWITRGGCSYRLERPSPPAAGSRREPGEGETVRAPMPAQVRAVQVAAGEAVEKGQTLVLLEAMKMEIRIKSPASGHILRMLVANGQAVEKNQVLVEIGG
jgi:geranyl-CoA carboxylase alpha subunit